jgi:pilus assembly protein Flp/PilA
MRNFYRLMRSTRAATAVEYGLILALVFLAAVGAMSRVGTATINMWTKVSYASTEAM